MTRHENLARREDRAGDRKPQPIRDALFAHIAGLLLDPEHPAKEAEGEALVDALGLLLPGIDIAKRKLLAERVNGCAVPPKRLLAMLARDDIAVAGIILIGNRHMRGSDLRTIAQTGSQGHRRAVARRDDLTAPITDALIDHGDASVIDTLARNPRAPISVKSVATLAADYRHIGSVEAFLEQTLGFEAGAEPSVSPAPSGEAPSPKPEAPRTVTVEPPIVEPVAPEIPPAPAPLVAPVVAPVVASVAPPPSRSRAPRVQTRPSPVWARKAAPQDVERIVISPAGAGADDDDSSHLPKALESAARARDFTRSASDWSWETDAKNRITEISEHSINAFGVPGSVIHGKRFDELGHCAANGARDSNMIEAMGRRIPFRGAAYLARSHGGGETHWLMNGVPVFDRRTGRFMGYRGTAGEITVDRAVKEQVRHSHELLMARRRQLQGRQEALEDEINATDQSNEDRGERLANLSHEFRTPLNAIIGFSEVIAIATAGTTEVKYSGPARAIRDAAWSLNSFVNDLLDSARMEAGRLEVEREPVEVHAVIGNAVIKAKVAADERGIDIHAMPFSSEIKVIGDETRIEQALGGMLDFAIKQSGRGAAITLDVVSGVGAGVKIGLECDAAYPRAGAGDDMFAKIQAPRAGTDDMPRIAPGFGLAFARDLARLMAGDLTAEPAATGTTRLVLSLEAAS